MKGHLLQSLRGFGLGGGGVLVLVFLLLPYLVDFAYYYGDFSAPDFAQRYLNDEKEREENRSSDDTKSPDLADSQAAFLEAIDLPTPDVCTQFSHPREIVTVPYCLSVASRTSRPPPSL